MVSPPPALFLPQIPLVPLSPALSIILNIYLMLKLSYMTWLRFAVWLLLGECSCGGCFGAEGSWACLGTSRRLQDGFSRSDGFIKLIVPLLASSSPSEAQAEVSQCFPDPPWFPEC